MLAVPGPGSAPTSSRMCPVRSMTTARSLCANIAPAGRFSTVIPYCRQTWLSWLSDPVRYSQFGTVFSPSSRSKAWVNATDR